MKKIILLLGLILLSIPAVSHATSISNMTAQLGVYNTTDNHYGLEVDNSNNFEFSATGASIKWPGSTKTTNYTLTSSDTGKFFVFNGSSNGTLFTLPTAAVGMQYTVIADSAKWFYIAPQSTDIINFSTVPTGQRISNTSSAAKGDSISLYCATVNQWSIIDKTGTWAANQ